MLEEITDQDWKHLQAVWDYLLIESELPDTADVIVIGGSGAMIDSAERAAEFAISDAVEFSLHTKYGPCDPTIHIEPR